MRQGFKAHEKTHVLWGGEFTVATPIIGDVEKLKSLQVGTQDTCKFSSWIYSSLFLKDQDFSVARCGKQHENRSDFENFKQNLFFLEVFSFYFIFDLER